MSFLRRRQQRIDGAAERTNSETTLTLGSLNTDNSAKDDTIDSKFPSIRKALYLFGILIGADLILTITCQTWPMSHSRLPMFQRLVYAPGSRGGTFAQNYQDTWVVALMHQNSNFDGAPLFFLDIGAYHGLWCSNSYLLENAHGWTGACVEPFPDSFEQRSCQLFVNAMSDTSGQLVDFSGAGQERTIGSPIEQRGVRKQGRLLSETISFPTLLERSHAPSFIAFVSLDVEGHEFTALQKFPFDKYTVGAWIVEGHSNAVQHLLESHGYKHRSVQNNGADDYYVADEYWNDVLSQKEWRVHPFLSWGC